MTVCLNCGVVLTNKAGERIHSANFDSGLPHHRMTDKIVWARCDACYAVAKTRRDEAVAVGQEVAD